MRQMRSTLLAAILIATASAGRGQATPFVQNARHDLPAPPSPRKVLPRDDSALDPTFFAFRNTLLAAALRGDLTVLRDSIAPTLNAGFETATRDQVLAALELREGAPWEALVDALRLGCVRERAGNGEHFIAPYVSAESSGVAGFDELAVLGRRVNLRSAASGDARVIEQLSYDVVGILRDHDFVPGDERPADLDDPRSWAHVITSTGATGFVFERYVRASTEQRYFFARINGRWLMTAMAAGD